MKLAVDAVKDEIEKQAKDMGKKIISWNIEEGRNRLWWN